MARLVSELALVTPFPSDVVTVSCHASPAFALKFKDNFILRGFEGKQAINPGSCLEEGNGEEKESKPCLL